MPLLSSEIVRDVIANRPSAASAGRIFFASDQSKTYRDNGASWDDVSDSGSGVSTARLINTTAPLTGGGDLSADRTLAISNFTGDSGSGGAKGAVPAPAAGDAAAAKFLKADGTWGVPAGTGTVNKYTTSWTSQTSVTVTHSLGTTAVIVQVFDGSGVVVVPESVTATSSSVVTLTFGASFTGSVVVLG